MKARWKRYHRICRCINTALFALSIAPLALGQGETPTRSDALALEQKGLNADAEKIWDAITKADPHNAEALAHLGLLAARNDQIVPAIDYYRQAIAIQPDLPGLQLNLGLALFKAAQYPDAIKFLSREIRLHPDDQRLTLLLGMAHYGMSDYLVAIPFLEKAVARDSDNLLLRKTLARSCLWSKQYHCILDLQKETLEKKAESAGMDILAAEALDAMSDLAGAAKQLRAAVATNPNETNVHFALGFVLWAQHQYAEAASEFQLELAGNPGNSLSRLYLADSLLMQDQRAQALAILEEIVASDTSQPLVYRDLGILYARSGRKEDAIRELKKAVELDPGSVVSRRELVQAYESMGRRDEASIEISKVNNILPSARAFLYEQIDPPASSAP